MLKGSRPHRCRRHCRDQSHAALFMLVGRPKTKQLCRPQQILRGLSSGSPLMVQMASFSDGSGASKDHIDTRILHSGSKAPGKGIPKAMVPLDLYISYVMHCIPYAIYSILYVMCHVLYTICHMSYAYVVFWAYIPRWMVRVSFLRVVLCAPRLPVQGSLKGLIGPWRGYIKPY